MNVERVKYVIWANDMERALNFYEAVFNGEIVKRSEVISEVAVAGTTIGIHGGGEGNVTWTGMTFQVADVVQGASEVKAAGGALTKEPQELEIPDRSRIRYRLPGMQSQKYHETKSIPHLKLALLIAQAVKLLQYQHLEHQHGINGRTPSLAPIPLGITQNRLELLPKQLPVDHFA